MKIEIELSNADAIVDFQMSLKKLRKSIRQVNFISENGTVNSYKSFPEIDYLIHSKMNDTPNEILNNKITNKKKL